MRIGGNVTAVIQIMTARQSEYGDEAPEWSEALELTGWLDMQSSQGSGFSDHLAKIPEATHVFLCDYKPLVTAAGACITEENSRMVVSGKVYNVVLYDDPVQLHEQWEIYLKYLGGQNGNPI